MNARLQAGMLEATRLTQAGQLLEATAMIQRVLRGESTPHAADEAPRTDAQTTLEGECRVVDSEPAVLVGTADAAPRASREPAQPDAERATAAARGLGARLKEQIRQHWREFRMPTPAAEPTSHGSPGVVPEGERFVTASYTNYVGTRSYKLYIPSGYHGQPLPLVVMLHGCTQNPDDFAAGTQMNALAEAQLCFVAYPAQTHAANSSKCWNWFKASDQQRDGGEPSIIAGLTRQIADNYSIDPQRIYVAGLSAGGAMAATMATTYPDLYAAAGVHSGLPHGAAQNLPAALAAMQGSQRLSRSPHATGGSRTDAACAPTIVFHGDRDTTVHPCNGEQVTAQSMSSHAAPGASGAKDALRVTVQTGKVPNGHAYTRSTHHDASGQPLVEHWLIHGAGHAWSGGSPRGSYTDSKGPDASREMLRFFSEHPQGEVPRRTS